MAPDASRMQGFYDEPGETMSPEARRAFQGSFLPSLVEYCFERSTTYRAKLEEAGIRPADVTTLEDLAKVPVTRKAETRDLAFEGIMAVPYNEARRIFVSPGPQFYAYGPIPQKLNPLLKVYHAVGFRPRDIVINTFTYHLTPAGINFDESLGEFGCAVVPAGPGSSDIAVEILQKLPVAGYVGTPSYLKIIASKARELGVDPRSLSLEVALTSAEPLPDPVRSELEEAFGIVVRQLYGSADGLLPCFECWAADGMHVPEMMILEITDPETGAPLPAGVEGSVTATVFNPYRPLLRFDNGDRGVLIDEPCVCGRTAVRFRFARRADAGVKVRGMFVYPEQVASAVARWGPSPWRAIVEHDARGLDVFRLEVEGAQGAEREIEAAVRAAVRIRPDVVAVPEGAVGPAAGTIEERRQG